MTLQIITARLTLTAVPLQVARAANGGKRQLETLIGAHVDDEWLDEDGRGLLTYYDYQLRDDPTMIGWGLWLIMHTAQRVVFGSAGFKGKPDDGGTIEIGYGISPHFRRQGYTFEAATALVEWGFAHPEVKLLNAECLPDNAGSARILQKLGMTNHGLRAGYLRWTLKRADYRP
ncbi:MAG TPA: GNAT family N-acetyltransferase [Phototrophicaceae bacterium]|nr:GNAT family N-acetyltransferase [Phototrophicaceae bacterium]